MYLLGDCEPSRVENKEQGLQRERLDAISAVLFYGLSADRNLIVVTPALLRRTL